MVYSFYFLCFGFTWMNSIVFGEIKGRGQKSTACSEGISFRRENDILQQYNDKCIMCSNSLRYHLIISELWKKFNIYGNNISISHGHLSSILVSSKTITFIPSGAKTQKKRIPFYSKCNVGASKNANQAFSTQRYLYICYRKEFFFSSVSSLMN